MSLIDLLCGVTLFLGYMSDWQHVTSIVHITCLTKKERMAKKIAKLGHFEKKKI